MNPYRTPPGDPRPKSATRQVAKVLLSLLWLLGLSGLIGWATWPNGPLACGTFVVCGAALVLTLASLRVLFGGPDA